MMDAYRSIVAAAVLSFGVAGCVSAAPDAMRSEFASSAHLGDVEPGLRAGDRVQVTVFGEDGLTGAYEVTRSGTLQMPLAGAIPAGGRSAGQVEAAIASALRKAYLRDPKVTVALVGQRPIYVLGEVEKPGEYPYREGLNLWRALAIAGGQTYRASTSAVLIQHAGEASLAERDTSRDIPIEPGDLIRVPERWF